MEATLTDLEGILLHFDRPVDRKEGDCVETLLLSLLPSSHVPGLAAVARMMIREKNARNGRHY